MSLFHGGNITEKDIQNLTIERVFYYYDEPKLFSCWLRPKERYLALWINDTSNAQEWLYIQVSDSRFKNICNGTIPLYAAFKDTESGEVYKISIATNNTYQIEKLEANTLPDHLLPDKSFRICNEEKYVGRSQF